MTKHRCPVCHKHFEVSTDSIFGHSSMCLPCSAEFIEAYKSSGLIPIKFFPRLPLRKRIANWIEHKKCAYRLWVCRRRIQKGSTK
jgi:hypothetical protein